MVQCAFFILTIELETDLMSIRQTMVSGIVIVLLAATASNAELMGHWKLNAADDPAPNQTRDELGRHHALLVNNPEFSTEMGKGLFCDGTSGQGARVSDEDNALTMGKNDFTICFRICFNSHHNNGNQMVLLEKLQDSGTSGWTIYSLNPGPDNNHRSLVLYTANPQAGAPGRNHVFAAGEFLPGQWIHITVTRKGDKITGYLNGKKNRFAVDTQGANIDLGDEGLDLYLGRRNPGDGRPYYLHAGLQDVRLYNHVLTDAEIKQLGYQKVPFLDESAGDTIVSEAGKTKDNYSIVLEKGKPDRKVVIHLSVPDDQVTIDKRSVTFTPSNWNKPQTVTVQAVDDTKSEGRVHHGIVRHRIDTQDPLYRTETISDLRVIINDDEFPVTVSSLDHNPMTRAIEGERYQAMVPDTLDIADRMKLALNALTNVWLPEEKWALCFVVNFSTRPPGLHPGGITDAYLNIPPKFVEAMALCRLGSGSDHRINIDQEVLRSQLNLLGADGLMYAPYDALQSNPEPRNYSEIWGEGRSLIALSMLAQIDDDPRWVEVGKRKIDRLLALTNKNDRFRFFLTGRFHPGMTVPSDITEPTAEAFKSMHSFTSGNLSWATIYTVGAAGHGAGLFYRATGYEPALELSRGLAHWALETIFKHEDGHWDFGHFHHGLYALMAVCEYAVAANDREVLDRVQACYLWAREFGDPLVGFYPENMSHTYPTTEICEVADMVWLALYLTRAGLGDYWDDVDRWLRNMYSQGQMVSVDQVTNIPNEYFRSPPAPDIAHVAQRTVGSFFGWMPPNQALQIDETPEGPKLKGVSIMHCCTGNGARTLYPVWESMVARVGEVVRVNLLLNRASQWLDIDSYLPVEGKVVLHIKNAPKIEVRVPCS